MIIMRRRRGRTPAGVEDSDSDPASASVAAAGHVAPLVGGPGVFKLPVVSGSQLVDSWAANGTVRGLSTLTQLLSSLSSGRSAVVESSTFRVVRK